MCKSDPIIPRAAFLRCVKEEARKLQHQFKLSKEGHTLTYFFFNDKKIDMGDMRMAALSNKLTSSGLQIYINVDIRKVSEG
jgi:hypothetical protein